MSQTIDSRVVQMQFENHQFESGAAQSMGTLKNLDKALKGVDGAQAFANISKAAGNVDLSGITSGVQALQERFSVMGTYVHNTLLGIAESAVNAGKQIANALVFSPAKTGFSEYELQIKSVQRILANTKSKGEDIRSVNAALDELNAYADQTIYNFAQMTDNIGRFTSSGVGLKESTTAIKGLSNAAALLGADSMAASRAGYQLSQALASGTIRLMDWNSLVNASMGGEKMQEAIMRVARHHGVAIDAMIEKEGSFRDTLQAGWLTSDIMLEALSHFTMLNDEASRSALEAAGYTQEEIDAIIELGETATQSATDVLGFTQLMDVVGEELGSVWAQTWRAIVGDYEEAKTTFTAIKDEIKALTGAWADWQVGLVEGWAELGGRTDLFDSLFNTFEALKSVLSPIGQALGDVFPPITAERLADLTRKLKDFTKGLILNENQMSQLKNVATTVFSGVKAGLNVVTSVAKSFGKVSSTVIGGFARGLLDIVKYIGRVNIAYKPISEWLNLGAKSVVNFANAIPGFIENVTNMIESGTLLSEIYDRMPKTLQHVSDVFQNSFNQIQSKISDLKRDILESKTLTETYAKVMAAMPAPIQKVMGELQNGFLGIKNTFGFIRDEAVKNRSVLAGINSWISTLGPAWQTILTPVTDYFGKVQIKLMEFKEAVLSANTPMEMLESMLVLLPKSVQTLVAEFSKFSKVLGVTLTDSFGSLKIAFSDFFNVVVPNFGEFMQSLIDNAGVLKDSFSNLFGGIGQAFKTFISSTPTSFDELKQNFIKLKDDIVSEFLTLKDAVKSFFSAMSGEDGSSMFPVISSEGFKAVVNAFKKLQTDIRGIFDKGWGDLKPHLQSMWQQLPDILGENIVASVNKIGELFNMTDLGLKLKDGLTKALSGIEGVLSRIFDGILAVTGASAKSVLNRIKDSFVESFGGLTESVGDSARKSGKSMTESLRSGIAKMPDVVENAKTQVVEKTKLMGAHIGKAMRPMVSNFRANLHELKDGTENLLVDTFNNAVDNVTTAVPKLASTIKTSFSSLPEAVGKFGENIKNSFASINNFLEKIPFKDVFKDIGDGLKGMYESIAGMDFSTVTDSIKKGFDWLINGGAKQIITALLALDLHGLLKKWNKDGKALADMFEKIGKSFTKLGKLFSGVSAIPKNFNKALRSMANKNNAEALKDVAKAVAIFSASIWLLSSIPWENMKVGLTGFAVAVGVAVAAMAAFTKISNTMSNNRRSWSLTKKGLKFEAADNAQMMGMATAMVAFAGAVGILSLAMAKLGSLGGNQAVQGVMGLATIVTMIVGSMNMLSKMDFKGMSKMIVPLVSVSLVIKLLSGVVEDIAALNPQSAVVAIAGIGVLLIGLSAVLNQMANVQKFSLKAIMALAAVTLVIRGLQPVIEGLSTLDPMSVVGVCGGLALLMLGIGQVLNTINSSKFKADINILSGNKLFGAFASLALLTVAIGGVIIALSKVENPTAAIVAATGIAALLVISGVLIHHINSLETIKPAVAATIAALGLFITMFATAIVKMALVANMNPVATITAFGAAITALALAVGLINRIPEIKNVGAAISLIFLGVFVTQFATAVSIMATLTALNPLGAIISTIACCTALAVLLRSINNLPDIKNMGAAASILALGVALSGLAKALIMLSDLSFEQMLTGLVGVGGILVELSVAIRLFGNNTAGIAGLRQAGLAFITLSVGLVALSKANPLYLVANLTALGVALFAFSKGASALKSALPAMAGAAAVMLKFSAAALLLSGAVALFGVGLQAVAVGLSVLSAAVVANIGLMTAAFTGLLYAFISLQPLIGQAIISVIQTICTVIVESSSTIADALGVLLLTLLDKLSTLMPELLRGIMDNLIQNMEIITEYAPQIADAFVNMFSAAVDAMTPKVPIVIEKLGQFLHVLLDELMKMLADLATVNIDQVGLALAGVIGVAALLGKFTGIFTAAVKGIGMLAILVAEIGAVILAFGAISKIPGVTDLVASGGALLGEIGYAIGNFVGSIIGGFSAGATSGLAELAANLSAFAEGIQPFIDTMKTGGGDLLSAVTDLSAAILLLTGADFLSGIVGFLTGGGTSLSEFGTQLESFATPFRSFCDKLDGINVGAVRTGAQAAKSLAEMMQILATSGGGGIKSWWSGDALSMDDFGSQIEKLGEALQTASTSFENVNSEAILAAIPAAEALAGLAEEMQRTGGIWQDIVGEQITLDNFGTQIEAFGEALKTASTAFEDVKPEPITAGVDAGKALADLAGEMQRTGGKWQEIVGEKITLDTFGEQVGSFAEVLKTASTEFADVKTDAILNAIPAAEALASLASSMESTGGVIEIFTGHQYDLAEFGTQISSFGDALSVFSDSMSGVDEGLSSKVSVVVSAMTSLNAMMDSVPDMAALMNKFGVLGRRKEALMQFADALKGFSDEVAGIDTASATNAAIAGKVIASLAESLPSQEDVDAIPDISTLKGKLTGFGDAIKEFGSSLEGFSSDNIINVTDAITSIQNLATQLNTLNLADFSGFVVSFKSAADSAINGFVTTMTTGGGRMSAAVSLAFNSLNAPATQAMSTVNSVIKTGMADVLSTTNSYSQQFSQAGATLIESLSTGMSDKSSTVSSTVLEIVKSSITGVSSQKQTFYNTGQNLVQGLINGMNSKKQAAIEAGRSLGSAVSQATRDATRVESPSKVFAQIGDYLVQGLALGINQNAVKAIRASRDLANNTITAMQEELQIESPSKVAKDEVGNWIVEGIAEGIEGNMSAEEAAQKKAENIINAFQEALDKIDFEFAMRDLDRKLSEMLDSTGTGARERQEAQYLDAIDKAKQELEYRQGAYETLLKQGLPKDNEKVLEAAKALKEAQLAVYQAQREYEEYVRSSKDKYDMGDLRNENLQKEFELWKLQHPMASDADIAKKQQELIKAQADLATQKAADAYAAWQASLQLYGEADKRTIEAYGYYLDAKKAYEELFHSGQSGSGADEYKKSTSEILREWSEFWPKFYEQNKELIDSGQWTMEQIAKSWSKDYGGYNPLTFQWEESEESKKIEELGQKRIQAMLDKLQAAQPVLVRSLSSISNGVVASLETTSDVMSTGMAYIGDESVIAMRDALVSKLPEMVDTTKDAMFTIPEQVIPLTRPEWVQAGLDLINAMAEGVVQGQGTLAEAVTKVVKQAVDAALASMKTMLGSVEGTVIANSTIGGGGLLDPSKNGLSENVSQRIDDATRKWLEEHPEYTDNVNWYWGFDSAKKQGLFKDWERDYDNSIVRVPVAVIPDVSDLEPVLEPFRDVAPKLAEGLAKGLNDSHSIVENATLDLIDVIPTATCTALKINSPSLVMEEFGRYIDMGLANGIADNTNIVGNAAISMLETVSTAVEESSDMPSIVPVIDLGALKHEVNEANKMLGRITFNKLTDVSGIIQNGSGSKRVNPIENEVVNNYDFTQNIYSPKALTNATIYRQTKNQFSSFVRKRG